MKDNSSQATSLAASGGLNGRSSLHAKAAARVLALLTRSLVARLLVLAFATGTAWAQIDLATACNDRAWPGTHDCTPVSPITPWTYQGIIELWGSGDPTYEVSPEAAANRQLQFIAATRTLCSGPAKDFVSGPSPTTVGFPENASVYSWSVIWSEPTFAPGELTASCKQPRMQDTVIRVVRWRQIACPPGFRNSQLDSNNVWTCSRPASLCDRDGHVRDCWANPVISLGGTKVHTEVDFEGGSVSPLRLVRHYRSASMQLGGDVAGGVFGQYWTHNYESRLVLNGQIGAPHFVSVYRMGRQMRFRFDGTVYLSQSGVADRLSRTSEGDWLLTLSTGQVERFDPLGRLVELRERGRVSARLTYAPNGDLSSVSDPFGRALRFNHDSVTRQLQSVITPDGATITYTLRRQDPRPITNVDALAAAGSGWLRETTIEQVTWQDGSVRRYHYEEPGYVEFPAPRLALLTGITDETGARTAHYRYTGGIGNISSVTTSLASDVNRYLIRSGADTVAYVYGPLDSMTTIEREWAPGGLRVVRQSECADRGFPCRTVSFNYDANGNISERIDPRGTTHGFAYDPVRNLEVRRTEGQGTPAARTVLTTWHPTWPIPTEVREFSGGVNGAGVPTGALLKRIVSTYDASGNLTRREEIDTVSTPTTRTWQWTYTTSGRVLTATDPNNRVTTFTYHSDTDSVIGRRGNLATMTNPAGHLTQYTAYDGNGRPTTIVDPNGVTRTLTYHPRGWLTSVADSIAGTTRTTTIAYLANGKVRRITQPDGSYLQLGYDAAQRLTSVADNLGNSVTYTLDNAGNRTDEQFRDSSNTLRQRVTRVFDTLSRLQSVTGALQ